jgi:hypothetical protein
VPLLATAIVGLSIPDKFGSFSRFPSGNDLCQSAMQASKADSDLKDALERLSLDPKIPPKWRPDVPFKFVKRFEKVSGHDLPAPRYKDQALHPDKAWSQPKAENVEVRFASGRLLRRGHSKRSAVD